MQTKLHRWARQDRACWFGDVFNLVYDPAFLAVAFARVATNAGAQTPGVDRATVTRIQRQIGEEVFLAAVRAQLKSGQFRPMPVRQTMIPKGNGKRRALGIPTITDRVVQASLKLVLEPIFEADFQPCSYGFRPGRRAQDAITELHMFASRGYEWIAEADIRACFDRIDHTALCDRLRVRVKDKRVMALVKAFLKAGVMTGMGERQASLTGTPQGGILSPLLANIALSVLDDHFMAQWHTQMGDDSARARRRRRGLGCYRLIRYADDFVVVCYGSQGVAERVLDEAAEVLAPMGLHLAAEKTRVVHLQDGFDFLGFWIGRRTRRGSHKQYVYTIPSKRAIASIKATIKQRTSTATQGMAFSDLLTWLGRTLRGWANYFRHGVSSRVFDAVDAYTWRRIAHWLRRKHDRLSWKALRRRFCVPGQWRFTADGIVFSGASSVAITRYRYRGYNIPTPWEPTPAPRTATSG
jgi:RNA-directed DNA polymerase